MTFSDVLQLLAVLAFLTGLGLICYEVFGTLVTAGILLIVVAVPLWGAGQSLDRQELLREVSDR